MISIDPQNNICTQLIKMMMIQLDYNNTNYTLQAIKQLEN